MKGDDEVSLAQIVARTDSDSVISRNSGKLKLGRGIANLEGHGSYEFKRWPRAEMGQSKVRSQSAEVNSSGRNSFRKNFTSAI
jgi:hypothetical protein